MAGLVYVNGQKEEKAGSFFAEDVCLTVKQEACPYVSRGGYKLEKALQEYPICLQDCVCMDIGASTGGFTDCMLQRGAKKVYAIDVGTNQLAWKLRQDERVICMEKTNARYLTKQQVPEQVDFISVDVAFISLTKILDVAQTFLKEDGEMVCLIKPQFEAGRDKVGKHGVVKDPLVHKTVIETILQFAKQCNCNLYGLTYSPIKGPKGNIEYLLYCGKKEKMLQKPIAVEETIQKARMCLDDKSETM